MARTGGRTHIDAPGADVRGVILTLFALALVGAAAARVARWRMRRDATRERLLLSAPRVEAAGRPASTFAPAPAESAASPGRRAEPGWDVPFFTTPPTAGGASGAHAPRTASGAPLPASPGAPAFGGPAPGGPGPGAAAPGAFAPAGPRPLIPAQRRPASPLPPFPTGFLVTCAVLALVCSVFVGRHHLLQHRLTEVATALVGQRATVHCQTFGETWLDAGSELGFVEFDEAGVPVRHTLIKLDPCRDLASWMRSDHDEWTEDQLIAVHVLTHEAMHMKGETDEARTECRAMQRDAMTARLLGASPDDARRLARDYWQRIYPRMSDGYRSGNCGPGGAWDENLPDAPWD